MNEEEVFCEAMARSGQERAAYLDHACADNPGMRASVEALLRANVGASGFIEGAAPGLVATLAQPITERPGMLIGSYKLIEQIGEGGFGVVFMAEQQQPVRRLVALKVLKPGMDTRQVIARFEAERQALALMDHPNIARVLEAGETPSGRPYFVMDLVRGLPITEFCDQNQFTPRKRLELFISVCQAVQHAHQKGIIHRDIKPSNVLVTLHDCTPVVKIIDFGISKALGQQLTEKTLVTGFAQMIGTPLYMSPEQAKLSGLDIDTRSDIYSLGVLLYELLTGTTPFEQERLHEAGYDEMRRIIREEDPPKPSTRLSTLGKAATTISERRQSDPRRLSQLFQGELDWIVMKALEKDRNRRYESANALAGDVQRHLNDETVEARPPSMVYKVRKFARRNMRTLATAAIVFVALLTLVGSIVWTASDRSSRQMKIEQAVSENLKEAEIWQGQEQWAKALKALELATDRLEGRDFGSLRAGVEAKRRNANLVIQLQEAILQGSRVPFDGIAIDLPDYSALDQAFARAFANNGMDVTVLPAEEIARQIRSSDVRNYLVSAIDTWSYFKERSPEGNSERLRTIARLADDDPWRRRLRQAWEAHDQKSLERLANEKDVLDQPPGNLLILSHLLHKAKAEAASVGLLRRAHWRFPTDFWINFTLGVRLGIESGNEPTTLADGVGYLRAALVIQPRSSVVYMNLAHALLNQRKAIEAEAACLQAIALKPDSAAYVILGGVRRDLQHNFPKAVEAFQEAIALNPKSAWAHNNLGVALEAQVSFSDAEAAYLKAIDLRSTYGEAYNNLGVLLAKQNKLRDAVTAFRKAIELNPSIAAMHDNLGHALLLLNQPREAEEEILTAIKLNPDFANAYDNLGQTLAAQNRLTEAEEAFRKGIERQPKASDGIRGNLENVLQRQHRFAAAVTVCREAIEVNPSNIQSLYNGACCAALAGRGQGKDATLDAPERARFRDLALTWLRALLLSTRSRFETNPDKDPSTVPQQMQLDRWQRDADFDGVRGAAALAKLPRSERKKWQKLWQEVKATAIYCYRKAIERNPNDVVGFRILLGQALLEQGQALLEQGDLDGAVDAYKETVQTKSGSAPLEALSWLAHLYEAEGNKEEAARWRAEHARAERNFVRDWLVLSELIPYAGSDGARALDEQQIPSKALLCPRAGNRVQVDGRMMVWKEYHSRELHIDFAALYGNHTEHRLAYAVCYVDSGTDRNDLALRVGSDGQDILYLNGVEKHRQTKPRALMLDQDEINPITLRKGKNILVFKVIKQAGPGPFGSLHFVNRDGSPAEGLRFGLEPD
jgi:serine/threonine protein kinase/Flp pilus assembly protein TadD